MVKNDSTVGQIEDAPGILLGKFDPYIFETKQLQFNRGDRIVLYTDGVTEAMDVTQGMYAESRFLQFLETYRPDSVTNLVRGVIVDVLKFMGKADQSDDITVFSLEYRGPMDGN